MKEDDAYTIAGLLVKYSQMSPHEAMKKLRGIDIVKNLLSEATTYNFLLGTRAFVNEGKVHKIMSKQMIEAIECVLKRLKAQQPKYIEEIKEQKKEEGVVTLNYEETKITESALRKYINEYLESPQSMFGVDKEEAITAINIYEKVNSCLREIVGIDSCDEKTTKDKERSKKCKKMN